MRLFSNRIYQFLSDHGLTPEGSPALAISAGVDSQVLLHVFLDLKKQGKIEDFSLIHINHKTRPETQEEADFIKDIAAKYNLKLDYFEWDSSSDSNFENEARFFRYHCYHKSDACTVYLAHHIDDSFEWHLMQKFKSSKACLGIPLRRGKFVRPMMCFTKSQIRHLANKENIKFYEDSTNTDINYERNFVRHNIIPQIKKRFPRYLKHYVMQMNETAKKRGVHLSGSVEKLEVVQKPSCTYLFNSKGNNFSGHYELIESEVRRLSSSKRGKLNSQIVKLVNAMKNNKSGPLSFSGGVKAYLYPNLIVLTNEDITMSRKYYTKNIKKEMLRNPELLRSLDIYQ